MDALRARWHTLWVTLGIPASAGLFERLLDAWREPQRHYHTLQHLEECLALFDALRVQACYPHEVELALWFHDAVYDVRAHDNEERSARWATEALTAAGLKAKNVRRVHELIMATCHGAAPAPPTDADTALLLDIDLAILGASHTRFAEYERQIRAEYAWVAPEIYAARRGAVLRGFLERGVIYNTPVVHARLEAPARRNLLDATATIDLASSKGGV